MYVRNEPLELKKIDIISVTTTAQDVALNGRGVRLQNQHDSATINITNKDIDGVATSSKGLVLFPKETSMLLQCGEISVIGSAACSMAVIYLD